jgi:hypothetical protein
VKLLRLFCDEVKEMLVVCRLPVSESRVNWLVVGYVWNGHGSMAVAAGIDLTDACMIPLSCVEKVLGSVLFRHVPGGSERAQRRTEHIYTSS